MENILLLKEQDQLDFESECRYSDITEIRNCYNLLHTHDYFEILLVVNGLFLHQVNYKEFIHKSCSIIFLRPEDNHRIVQYENKDCHLINLTYRKRTFFDLSAYFGQGFDTAEFLKAKFPPCIAIDRVKMQEISTKLELLNTIPESEKLKARVTLRQILSELFYNYIFILPEVKNGNIPEWISSLCMEMKQKDNFSQGIDAMIKISGKTHEHICRSFKKYLDKTPGQFLNEIRLSYAGNLLRSSDKCIDYICFEIGFESLGHFYKLFSKALWYSVTINL